MRVKEIIKRQWQGYAKFHQSRVNLLIHVIAVPVFILGVVQFLFALLYFKFLSVIFSLLLMALSMGAQGIGHKKEAIPAEPFTSAQNAIVRILLEQLYTFPKFVLSGGWYQAYRTNTN